MENLYSEYKDISDDIVEIDPNVKRYNKLKNSSKYKWITYQRNGSWFITRCDMFQIIRHEESQIIENNEPRINIKYNDRVLPVIDIFSKFPGNKKEQIKLFLIINFRNKLKCFAVNKLGKRIMANNDFITPHLKAFEKSRISSGRFRIFGKNHIYL